MPLLGDRLGLYVASQTTLPPGITLIRGRLGIDADDVTLQYVRVRPGDEIPTEADGIGNDGDSTAHSSRTLVMDRSKRVTIAGNL